MTKYFGKMYRTNFIFCEAAPSDYFQIIFWHKLAHKCNLENKAHDSAVHAELSYSKYSYDTSL